VSLDPEAVEALHTRGTSPGGATIGWPTRREWLRRLLPAALLTCVLALLNHFPLTYPDSGNYLGNAVSIAHGREPWFFYRPLTYGVFLVPFSRAQTIWLLPLAQGLLIACVVELTLRRAGVCLPTRWFVGLFAGLSACTSLPWFSGQIMPDIFTSVVIMLSFVTLWDADQDSRWQRWSIGALLAFAIATHLSHFAIYGVLASAGLAGRAMIDRGSRSWRVLGRLALRATVPLVVAIGLVVGPNYYFHRELVLSRSSALFALGHLVGEGMAQRYLERACPTRHYLLCSERKSLVPNVDWFLWAPAGSRKHHEPEMQRGDSTFLREAPAIVAGTLREEWPALIGVSLKNAVVQLGIFEIQPGEHRFSRSVDEEVKVLGPRILRAYRASGEVRSSLPFGFLSRLHYAAFGLGIVMILVCWPRLQASTHRRLRILIATLCLGVLVNALVVVSLASVQARYQSRVAWLVPMAAMVAAACALGAGVMCGAEDKGTHGQHFRRRADQ
jgi:hypothetical protein